MELFIVCPTLACHLKTIILIFEAIVESPGEYVKRDYYVDKFIDEGPAPPPEKQAEQKDG